ncbi:MAG: hypothetical protein IJS15_02530 [Victivallales bacterium]|nr:hypothetical protein [Victivallales bacterium]
MQTMSWSQIKKLGLAYIKKPSPATAESLDKGLMRSAEFLETIARFFVRRRQGLEDATVEFRLSDDGIYHGPACDYNPETQVFRINVIEVLKFQEYCQNAPELIKTPEGRGNGNFSIYRLNAYKAELRKLPDYLVFVLLLFQQVAQVLQVTYVEKRRTLPKQEIDKDDLDYLNLVWAFLELEHVYRNLKGNDLRSDIKFTWFESEWATEKK